MKVIIDLKTLYKVDSVNFIESFLCNFQKYLKYALTETYKDVI